MYVSRDQDRKTTLSSLMLSTSVLRRMLFVSACSLLQINNEYGLSQQEDDFYCKFY